MPELPEVETVRRTLLPHLSNKRIIDTTVNNAQVISTLDILNFTDAVRSQTVADFIRRGKYLQLVFASGDTLTLHLRMTGCLTVEPHDTPCAKHTHVVFVLDDGFDLRYRDTRRFGRFWFTRKTEPNPSGINELGIEPFDVALNTRRLKERCEKSKRSVKQILLDQSAIAGIGNIYSDEICFSAHILPERAAYSLSDSEIKALAETIAERLKYFIEKNEISFEDYVDGKGEEYRNAPFLQVYGKAGKPCPACGTSLSHTVINGRSSCFCAHCQK